MKLKELKYEKKFNLGNYSNETITLSVELEKTDYIDGAFQKLKGTVLRLQKQKVE